MHRIYRVLAERAARSGMAVLRFDAYGTGDAAGGDTEGTLAGWAEDVVTASRELTDRAGLSHLVWLGARLGATTALQASVLPKRRPDDLILWEPVVDGPAYRKTLSRGLADALQFSLDAPEPALRARLARGGPELEREGIGFELGPVLLGELEALSAARLPLPRAGRCTWIHDGQDPAVAPIVARWRAGGLQVAEEQLHHGFDWVAEEALNSALVPAEVVQRLSALVARQP